MIALNHFEFDPDEALPDEDEWDDDCCAKEMEACGEVINPRYNGPGSWDRPFNMYLGVISPIIRLESSYG